MATGEEKGNKHREPLTNPSTGAVLAQREQPGYYAGFNTLGQQKYWDAATRKLVVDRATKAKPIRFFNPDEARTIGAVIDRVLPQDDRTPERRIDILTVVDERLFQNKLDGYQYADMPSDREAYHIAAKAFLQMAEEQHGQRFDELTTLQQEELIDSVHKAKPAAAEDIWKQMNIERFWAMFVADVVTAYYAHPWAWDEVGFGGPAYPRGYMRLEEGEPEPWEVDEQRYAWAAPSDTISDKEEQMGSGLEHQTPHSEGGTH